MVLRGAAGLVEHAGWKRPPTIAKLPEQLELRLFPGEPWEGVSPRGLTRGHLGLIFKPQGVRARAFLYDPNQLELWPTKKSARRKGRIALLRQ